MTPQNISKYVAPILAFILWSGMASAGPISLVIDDFSTDQAQAAIGGSGNTFSPGSATVTSVPANQVDGLGITGAYRDLYVESSGGTTGFIKQTGTSVAIGPLGTGTNQAIMQVDNDDSVTGTVVLVWDGAHEVTANPQEDSHIDTDGLGGVDFLADPDATLANSGILLEVLSLDLSGVIATFDIWDTDGTKATASKWLTTASTDHLLFFNTFSTAGGSADAMNWSQVGAVRMTLTGPAGWDGSFGMVAVDPVPEPMSVVLLGSGLGLLGLWRRRKLDA